MYQATIHVYKECLKLWNQGTGGRYFLDTMFETWSEEKLLKYHIDDDYDHTRVSERPSILMEGYTKKKKYLTCIFMWDEKLDFLLSSRYEPLNIGVGEVGIRDEDNSIASCVSSSTS